MAAIGIIINPHARYNRRHRWWKELIRGRRSRDLLLVVTETLDEVDRVVHAFRQRQVAVVAISGGDGTVHLTLSAIYREYAHRPLPALALLRGGTMNTLANACGIHGRPAALLRRLIQRQQDDRLGERTERDTILLEGRLGFLFGNGILYHFLQAYYQGGDGRPTHLTAVGTLVRGVGSVLTHGSFARELFTPFRATLDFDRRERTGTYTAIAAGTIDQIGLGFRPFIYARERPGTFHALAITSSPWGLARALPRIRRGRPLRSATATHLVTDHLRVVTDRPQGYMLDGELYPARDRLELEVGPRVQLVRL